jgi:dynactin 1
MSEFKIGQTVETSAHQQGLIKYIGPIHVAEGNWLGIELSSPHGKNDGSVRGERYFDCPPAHGLFVRDTNIVAIIAQPAPKPAPAAKISPTPKAAAPISKPRPSSVVPASKAAPRPSTINKRTSVAPSSSYTTSRAAVRKASIAETSTTSTSDLNTRQTASALKLSTASSSSTATTTNTTLKSSRDHNVETLQTKIRHLEKQHAETQDRLKELSQVQEERDRFHGIIQKLQTKCQNFHQESVEAKTQLQHLQSDHDRLAKAQEEFDQNYELATLDKEMAEERAEQAEAELDTLRERLEEREMEVDILKDEAQLFTTDMSEEEREQAGYYRLQHENDRLRQALMALKEMTGEQEQDLKARVRELEDDAAQLEPLRQTIATLEERVASKDDIIEHLQAQVDANSEWEEVVDQLSAKTHDLEEQIAEKDVAIRDLESLKELNDELEVQHIEQEEELHADIEAKDLEIAEQSQRINEQMAVIADHEDLVSKFRDLVFELQGKMADAETSRNMTEAQAKDTRGRFNEVMDLNRRLRASNVAATKKEITSELRQLRADEASEKLTIWIETRSEDFGNSESLHAYFTAKSIAFKATLVSNLLAVTDRQLSFDGGLDESQSRLLCVEAIYHLSVIKAGGDRLWSAIKASSLTDFAKYGPTYQELITVEKALDQGLDALKVDEVNFRELAGSFGRSTKIQEAVLLSRQDTLAMFPEDITLTRVRTITASLNYLESNLAVVNTMLKFLATEDAAIAQDDSKALDCLMPLAEDASKALEKFTRSAVTCNKALAVAQKMLKTVDALRVNSLYPQLPLGLERLIDVDALLAKLAHEAAEWGQNAVKLVNSSFDPDGSFIGLSFDLDEVSRFYWSSDFMALSSFAMEIDEWADKMSALVNSREIEHGPTPWSQKAKEAEATRKKDNEASTLLENLKAEHKATRLSLLERDRVLETKLLEIEHLEAKIRDATNKVGEQQQLHDKIMQLSEEFRALEKQSEAQFLEVEFYKERIARLERHERDAPELNRSASSSGLEDTEQSPSSHSVPAGLIALVNALQDENHWLRQREHAELFDRNLKDASRLRGCAIRYKGYMAGTVDVEDYDSDGMGFSRNDIVAEALFSSAHVEQLFDTFQPRTGQRAALGPKKSPLTLEPVHIGWQPQAETPVAALHRMQNYEYEDLSIIQEEEGDFTMELEGSGEIAV